MVQVRDGSLSAPLVDLILALIANANGQSATDTSGLQTQLDAITDGIARMRGTEGVDVLGSLESGLIIQGTDDAAGINVADAGNYFTGTDVEAVLQELGSFGLAGSNLLPQVFQKPLGDGAHWVYQPINAAAAASYFGFDATTLTGIGNSAAVTIAATSTFTRQQRLRRLTTATTAGLSCGRSPGTNNLVACLDGGFILTQRFGCSDAATVANGRAMVGLTALATAPANANPSASTNIITVGWDSGDANLQLIHNDGSGTATKVDLGANFPANTLSTDWYEVTFLALPGAGTVNYFVRRVNTGDTTTGSITTDLPSGSTLLGPLLWRNNGTTALEARISDGGFYFRPNLESN